jgi:hypothetical protein
MAYTESKADRRSRESGVSPVRDEAYFLGKFKDGVISYEYFPEDCFILREQLYKIAEVKRWSAKEIAATELAEMVMLESLEEAVKQGKTRADGYSLASHLYQVAVNSLEWGFPPRIAAIALDHDTVEDTRDYPKQYRITEEMLAILFDQYDPKFAHSVGLLSKLKSTKGNKNNPLGTHTNLYELIEHDQEAIIVKLEDRIHYLKTSGAMPREKVASKSKETMEYYVPLAVGLGLHEAAQELTGLCAPYLVSGGQELVFPFSREQYQGALATLFRPIEEYRLTEKDSGIVDIHGRTPGMADAYRMTEGLLSQIDHAWLPAYLTVVMKDSEEKSISSTDGSFIHIALPLVLRLKDAGILSESDAQRFLHLIGEGVQRTTHIDVLIDGVPVRLRFAGEQEEHTWQASILDLVAYTGVVSQRKEAALRKLKQLEGIYEYFQNQGVEGTKLLTMLQECLTRGTTTAFFQRENEQMTPIVMPANATVSDMVISSFADEDVSHLRRIERKIGERWHRVPLRADVERNSVYRARFGKGEQLSVNMLDAVQTQYGIRYIQELLKKQLKKDGELNERLAQQLIDRGISTLKSLYAQYAREQGSQNETLSTDISVASEAIEEAYYTYPMLDRRLNFLLRIGLRELFVDSGRTSLVWKAVRTLYAHQSQRREVRWSVANRPGKLHTFTSTLKQEKINIAQVVSEPDYRIGTNMGDASIVVTLDPKEYNRFMGIDAKRKKRTRRGKKR